MKLSEIKKGIQEKVKNWEDELIEIVNSHARELAEEGYNFREDDISDDFMCDIECLINERVEIYNLCYKEKNNELKEN